MCRCPSISLAPSGPESASARTRAPLRSPTAEVQVKGPAVHVSVLCFDITPPLFSALSDKSASEATLLSAVQAAACRGHSASFPQCGCKAAEFLIKNLLSFVKSTI